MLTQSELKEVLHYDPETGYFTWLKTTNSRAVKGSIAGWNWDGHYGRKGNVQITYNKQKYAAHRLVWLYVYGEWPENEIDHINRVRHDNRLCNLREATHSQNMANHAIRSTNKTGFKGVYFDKFCGKYRATCSVDGKRFYLGSFNTVEEAAIAYDEKAKELQGEFAVLNFPNK